MPTKKISHDSGKEKQGESHLPQKELLWYRQHRTRAVHCKYFQCKIYSFSLCSVFWCTPAAIWAFNYCTNYSGITVYLVWSGLLYHLHFYVVLCMSNTWSVYSFSLSLKLHITYLQCSESAIKYTANLYRLEEKTCQIAVCNTGGPQIVLFLRPQWTILLRKTYYSGTDLVLKLWFMSFAFQSPLFFAHFQSYLDFWK